MERADAADRNRNADPFELEDWQVEMPRIRAMESRDVVAIKSELIADIDGEHDSGEQRQQTTMLIK